MKPLRVAGQKTSSVPSARSRAMKRARDISGITQKNSTEGNKENKENGGWKAICHLRKLLLRKIRVAVTTFAVEMLDVPLLDASRFLTPRNYEHSAIYCRGGGFQFIGAPLRLGQGDT